MLLHHYVGEKIKAEHMCKRLDKMMDQIIVEVGLNLNCMNLDNLLRRSKYVNKNIYQLDDVEARLPGSTSGKGLFGFNSLR